MKFNRARTHLAVAVAWAMTSVGVVAAAPDVRFKAGLNDRHKVEVSDPKLLAALLAGGAELVADYGSFQRLITSSAAFGAADVDSIANRDDENRILLHAGVLDTTTDAATVRRHALAAFSGRRLHLLQFAAPVTPQWLERVRSTGVQVVTYIPNNAYLVYGSAGAIASVQALAQASPQVQWEGEYAAADRVHPAVQRLAAAGDALYAVQLVADADANPATVALIQGLATDGRLVRNEAVLDYRNVIVRLSPAAVATLAGRPDVVFVCPYVTPKKMDERQDQIIAGNLIGNLPSGPGYLAWLASCGFSQAQFDASGFVVDVTDSGIDNGTTVPNHLGLYPASNTGLASRVVYARLVGTPNTGSTIQGTDGHGNLNSHIIAGYNDRNAWPHTDAAGYRFGLGVCPFVRVGSSVIFDPSTFTSPNYANLISQAYQNGARISSDSWGADSAGAYNLDSQAYDALVRDAQPAGSTYATAGNQEMTIVFAAGNAGAAAQTVGSPGTAKNVITVGATENVRSHAPANGGVDSSGSDGCGLTDIDADSSGDMAFFSSRGPCADGRHKPDLVAPGTHVTGGVGQSIRALGGTGSALTGFDATGVCALPNGGTVGSLYNFFPTNQQFYTTSSGTSHSTPAVAGGVALIRQYFINRGWSAPSPAMVKAWLLNSARYLSGLAANDTLWSDSQGMGGMNLGAAFDGVPRVFRDQLTNDLFTATGQTRSFTNTISEAGKPVRVSLAWTDAPGATSGNAYKNNLDLRVSCGGVTYLGNVFGGAYSIPGGTADPRNNAESVVLPAGTSGMLIVTVTAANINSDGVPNYGGTLDQDFALVVYNAVAGLSNQPPELNPIDNQGVGVNRWLSFTVSASDPMDNDTVTLTASNIPPWSGFSTVSGTGLVSSALSGMPDSTGACVTTFFAYDKDGTNSATITINATMGETGTNLLFENFDASTSLPPGWSGVNSANTKSTSLYHSAPNCRSIPVNATIITPAVSGPTQLIFYADCTAGGGKSGVVEYAVSGGGWVSLNRFAVTTAGVMVTNRLNNVPNLASTTNVMFRFSSTLSTWYIDDVSIIGVKQDNPNQIVDVNGNGINDAWEMKFFGGLSAATPFSDHDGDGFSDLNEFLAGTDPTSPLSKLMAVGVANRAGSGAVISWLSVSNHCYGVERAANRIAGFSLIATNVPATPPVNVHTDASPPDAAEFYRVRLWP